MMQHTVNVRLPASATAVEEYVAMTDPHTVLGGTVVVTDLAVDEISTVDVYVGATKVGTATIPDNAAVGSCHAIVMSATLATRKKVADKATPIKVVTGAEQTTVTGFAVALKLDAYALQRD